MNPERWQKIESILQDALDLPQDGRAAFVRDRCGDDEDLRGEIERLIARHETDESFLESPVWTDSLLLHSNVKKEIADSLEEINPLSESSSLIGKQIGVYRLTAELGRGGMGMVFLAERADGEFRQNVAVKLIKRGMDTDFILRRFRQERQIAATLNHPNIARLLDGGTTSDGSPYFIMEYVEGSPFFKYAAANKLDLREKLELFLQVCAAIAYAHKRRIIHRDIKPGNIVVTADGEPKLLDFGIAKILDPDLMQESMMPTATQMRLMTPEYASPEQVRGDEITEASDQYSLGVLLYELLTGNRPYKFPSRAPHEIAYVICEEMPSAPSSGDFGKFVRENAALSAFDQDFCRKIDRIVLKSLRKNPAERYASVVDFARDIERFLRNEPVSAEPFIGDRKTFEEVRKYIAAPAVSQQSIAVLPFKVKTISETQNADQEFLGIGLADALITRLSIVRQFLVRPTSSVLNYGGADADSFMAGRDLDVEYILDGSLIITEFSIRTSVQLLKIADRSVVWAKRFDEDLAGVLELEDSISSRVVESLVPQMSAGETQKIARRATNSAEAYETFLRGRFHWSSFTEEGFLRAIEYYREAINLDPGYAQAHAAIADYYNWLGMSSLMPNGEFYPAACAAARRAIEIDPNSSEAYAALGLAQLYGGYDWKASEKNMLRAIELNPNNSVAHLWYVHNLYSRGDFIAGKKHISRALELDPTSFQNYNTKAWSFYYERRLNEAVAEADNLIERFPAAGYLYFGKGVFLRFQGKTEESLKNSYRAINLSDDPLFRFYGHAAALAATGKREEALEIIDNPPPRYNSTYHAAIVYCYLKDKEKAFEMLKQALSSCETTMIWIAIEPALDLLRDDARYLEILKRIDHPALETIYKHATTKETASVSSQNNVLNRNSNAELSPPTKQTISPRRAGIKQGILLVIVSLLSLPPIIVLLIAASRYIHPMLMTGAFLIGIGVGLARILYAVLYEPKTAFAATDSPESLETSFSSRPTGIQLAHADTGHLAPAKNRARKFLYALAAVSLLSFGYLVYRAVVKLNINSAPKFEVGDESSQPWRGNFAATMTLKRLTTSGKAKQAVLSPDGANVAYVSEDGTRQSLWIRSTQTENVRQLIAPEAVFYTDLKFSPDGKYVYYITSRAPLRTLYRAAVDGGAPEKISSSVNNLFALAPDGRRIVYDSRNPDNNQNSLFIAELDENAQIKSARTLVVLEMPNYFPGGIAFSPDGERVIYPRSVIENNREVLNLFVYDLATNRNERLGDKNFERIAATAWRKNGSEIVISARESDSPLHQLWLVSYPSGEVSRLTNDLADYYGVSLTADSTALATTKIELDSAVWTGEISESARTYESRTKQITGGVNRQDGASGVSWTKDERILYATGAGAERGIGLMNADGSNYKPLTTGALDPRFPFLTDDNRFLIYADKKEQELNIWRYDLTNGKSERVSSRYAVTPTISPDNRSIVYAMMPDASSNRLVIHRQLLAGGEEVKLTSETSVRPVVSPDGRFVACNYAGEATNRIWQIAVLPMETNSIAPKFIQPYKNNFFISPQERPLAWSPDGRFLYFLNTSAGNIANIFRVAVEDIAAPVQVTHFTSGEIFDFALAPDGKSFAIARGATTSDIVIFNKER